MHTKANHNYVTHTSSDNFLSRDESLYEGKRKKTTKAGWKDLETSKLENRNERKYRKARHFALVGIPILSVAFIALFFGIGYFYIFSNS